MARSLLQMSSKYLAYSLIHNYCSVTAPVLAADGECPDRYQFPICTVDLCFPEAFKLLSILYFKTQPVAASMNYLIQFAQP